MARTGISLTINALSGIIFIATVALVLGYYAISRKAKTPFAGVKK